VTEIECLVAIEEISQLKARYFRCMDTKDWDGFEAVFAPDAMLDSREAMFARNAAGQCIQSGRVVNEKEVSDEAWQSFGAANIRKAVEGEVNPLTTTHHGHMPEIEITSPSTARGIWAMEDIIRYSPGHALKTLIGYGHYHETYERIDGKWHIKTLKLTRLRVDIT
jgi:hypothetical protein